MTKQVKAVEQLFTLILFIMLCSDDVYYMSTSFLAFVSVDDLRITQNSAERAFLLCCLSVLLLLLLLLPSSSFVCLFVCLFTFIFSCNLCGRRRKGWGNGGIYIRNRKA